MKKSITLMVAFVFLATLLRAQDVAIPSTKKEQLQSENNVQFNTSLNQPIQNFTSSGFPADSIDIDWTNFGAGKSSPVSLEFSPDGNGMYATKGAAIFKSTDKGVTWAEIYKIPELTYMAAAISDLTFHESDNNTLYYNIKFAYSENNYGLYKLDLTTLEATALYEKVRIEEFCILGTTNADTIAVALSISGTISTQIWVTVDGGQWWKPLLTQDGLEQIEYYYNDNNNKELVVAGIGGMWHLDFDQSWATQTFNWVNDIETIERADTVEFTRTVGPMAKIPGTKEFLVAYRWFSSDKYESGAAKRAKFWKVSFEDKFAYEYTNIVWNDDTTGYYDSTQRGFSTTDHIWSYAFDKNNPDTWWVGEGNEILHTTDAGLTWSSDTFAYRDMWILIDVEINPDDPQHLFIVGDTDALETTDAFENFTAFGVPGLVILDLDYQVDESGNRSFFYNDLWQRVYSENDNGELLGWLRLEYDFPTFNALAADPFNEGRTFMSTGHAQGSFIHRTDDFAKTETQVFNSINIGAIRTLIANPNTQNEIWFLGDPNTQNPFPTAMKSRYGGDLGTWTILNIETDENREYIQYDHLVFHPDSAETVYCVATYIIGIEYVTDVLKSTDAGKTWTAFDADNGLPKYGNGINKLAINPFNPQYIYGSTFQWPYITNDGGETWNEQVINIHGYDTITGFRFMKVEYTGFENVMVGLGYNNDLVISNNNGYNWVSLRDNITLPDHLWLSDFEIDYIAGTSNKLAVYISTQGASMFKLELTEEQLQWENPENGATSIQGLTWNHESFIYPNPSKGIISIDNAEGVKISIYNQAGSLIHSEESYDKNYHTNILQNYPAGLYIITVQDKSTIRSDKIILTN